ncbi:xaa-Pro aminopeptidase ApepP isoform X2 [Lucilia cuprina]|nr:xaa-Pro aminopeptidase ApepP isoform X2 [Lucilia cuprina]
MKDTTEILLKLRKLMQNPPLHPELKIAAYIVPSDDAHQSEYICEHDERRSYVSGFDGSAGTAVITMDKALLWTDGRYYQQALKQLDKNWTLMKDGLPTTPSIGIWLSKNIPKGSAVGVDPKLYSYRVWKPIEKDLLATDCSLIPVEDNLIDLVWGADQPKPTSNPIVILDLKLTGESVADKWEKVKNKMNEKNCEVLVVSALDEVAWFLNLRGSDISYNPVFFAYLIITKFELMLFIDDSKLPHNFHEHEVNNGIEVKKYSYQSIGEQLNCIITPIAINKAIKNATELEGFINCHVRDGIALCQYFAWLEHMITNKHYVDEISGADKLEEFRSKNLHFMGLSFPTISSSGPNGSVIHYHPAKETNRQITDKEIYLCDSGAQYMDGTTDVTRTLHFGIPTDFEKECYTRVLKGQLVLGSTIFPKKVKGQVLDTLARKSLWDVGLDYGHGTGHGVGHFLNVHEGPMGIGIRLMPDDPGLQENMIMSNEPGFYKDGVFGIRIEDLVQIVPADTTYDFNGRGALTFKTITLCPKQTKMIKKELLLQIEVSQRDQKDPRVHLLQPKQPTYSVLYMK